MSGKIIRNLIAASVLAILAGCNSSDTGGALSLGLGNKAKTAADPAQPVVVQGACPQLFLREGTAFYTLYAKGAKKTPDGQADPEKLRYQATLSQVSRQCRQSGSDLIMTVVAYGRLVSGPVGEPGTIALPIRVAATDGDATVYTELSQYQVALPSGQGSTQFIFSKADVVLPGGVGPLTKVFIGFDEGPTNGKS